MKLNKRIKSSLIQTFIFNVILLVILIALWVLVFWPSFNEIEEKKNTLSTEYSRLNNMKSSGIEFQDFKELSSASDMSGYLKEVIQSTWDEFYVRNFRNDDTDTTFESFIADKEISVLEEKKSSLLENKTEIVDKLLPVYVTNDLEEWINDFDFINYVESLLYSFNLISTDGIWIDELKRAEDMTWMKSNLDSNIFYIPLRLEVTWQKADIIDFIHYFENVGSINIDEWDTKVYTDNVLSQTIGWNASEEPGNIYKNQLSDIKSISMDRYLDASSEVSRGSLTDFVKTTQSRQRFTAELDLRFYVQWLPDYKIENYIQSVVKEHSDLLSESQQALKLTFNTSLIESSSVLKAKNAIRSAANVLTLMQDDIKKLRVSLWRQDKDLTLLYTEAEWLKSKLDKISTVMQESAIILNTKK